MRINNYVLVTKVDSELFRRRCQITDIIEEDGVEKYVVYSEGLDDQDILTADEFEPSKY